MDAYTINIKRLNFIKTIKSNILEPNFKAHKNNFYLKKKLIKIKLKILLKNMLQKFNKI